MQFSDQKLNDLKPISIWAKTYNCSHRSLKKLLSEQGVSGIKLGRENYFFEQDMIKALQNQNQQLPKKSVKRQNQWSYLNGHLRFLSILRTKDIENYLNNLFSCNPGIIITLSIQLKSTSNWININENGCTSKNFELYKRNKEFLKTHLRAKFVEFYLNKNLSDCETRKIDRVGHLVEVFGNNEEFSKEAFEKFLNKSDQTEINELYSLVNDR